MSSRLLAGRYELIEKIGEGGMAIVYKAKCRLLNRYVAIKILRPEFTKDEQFVENFRRESQAAAGLSHPNIVSVYDVGQEGNIHFIVMELVEGKTLSELIEEKGRLDLPGRPLLYGTTPEFLKCFCIESLSELPELPEREEKEQETEKEEAKTFEVPAEEPAQPAQAEPEDGEDFDFDEFDVDADELENMYE